MEESKGRDWSKGDLRKSDAIKNQGKMDFEQKGVLLVLNFTKLPSGIKIYVPAFGQR